MTALPEIGLVGLGNIGLPLARNLLERRCPIVGFDVSPEARRRAEEAGVAVSAGLGDLAARCRTVLLSLPSPTIVRAVVPDIVARAGEGTVLVDLSTNDPETARAMSEAAAARGLSYLDAPISGGPSRARTGELTVMVGGCEAALRSVSSHLAMVGKQVEYVGASGAGCTAKILNNFVAIWGMIGVTQAFLAAEALGVDLERFQQVLSKSSARSYALDRNAPKIRGREFKPDFSMVLAQKDMGLALRLMRSAGIPSFVEDDLTGLFERSVNDGPDRDVAAILETLGADGQGRRGP